MITLLQEIFMVFILAPDKNPHVVFDYSLRVQSHSFSCSQKGQFILFICFCAVNKPWVNDPYYPFKSICIPLILVHSLVTSLINFYNSLISNQYINFNWFRMPQPL